MKKFLTRCAAVLVSTTTVVFSGFTGLAMADSGTIHNTGPDSYNKIEFNNDQSCEVTNENNVNISNNVQQNATSGNATVGGGDWGEWDPWVWAQEGKSQAEWQSAFSAYMEGQNYDRAWSGGGGNTNGGSATSGDVSNYNSANFNVEIENGGCGDPCCQENGHSNNPGGTQTAGASTSKGKFTSVGGAATTGGSGGASNAARSGVGGGVHNGSNPGGQSGGNSDDPHHPGCGCGGGNSSASISETGPDSDNSITFNNNQSTTVNNTNVVNVANNNYQNASSGNATVSGNTNGEDASTGDASNAAHAGVGVAIQN